MIHNRPIDTVRVCIATVAQCIVGTHDCVFFVIRKSLNIFNTLKYLCSQTRMAVKCTSRLFVLPVREQEIHGAAGLLLIEQCAL